MKSEIIIMFGHREIDTRSCMKFCRYFKHISNTVHDTNLTPCMHVLAYGICVHLCLYLLVQVITDDIDARMVRRMTIC